jgi:hypothetical protein
MHLSARVLKDVQSVNSFEPDTELSWTEGDTLDVHLQLIDVSLDRALQGFQPEGRRYVPTAGATLSCVIENIDDAKKITRLATQPFANDGSIWRLNILSTDVIRGTPQLRLTLTEGTKVTRGLVRLALKIHPRSNL